MLQLQGLSFSPGKVGHILREFSDAQLADLAGNSFSGPACSFGFLVFITVFGCLIPSDDKDLESVRQAARSMRTSQSEAVQAPGGS